VTSARAEILERVRATNDATASLTPTPRDYRQADERSRDELVALFCERLRDYNANVQYVRLPDVPGAIGAAASRHRARRIVIPDESLTPHELDQLDGVITGCTVAIAETGTIALSAGPHEGRRLLTLVPDMHICVVRAEQIVATVPEAMAQLGPVVRESRRPVTLISGPSATSDIELQRVEGVHGPRKLIVVVIQERA